MANCPKVLNHVRHANSVQKVSASKARNIPVGFCAMGLFILSFVFFGLCYGIPSTHWLRSPQLVDTLSSSDPIRLERSWAMYSPYFPVETYQPPPKDCEITQVNILQRHGARFPTVGAAARIVFALTKLQSVETYTDLSLFFLKNFTYDLGSDDLVPFGAAESQKAGSLAFNRYSKVLQRRNEPFVRASSGQRVIDSANNWTTGFASASRHTFNPTLSVILNEHLNDTLHNLCPNAPTSDPETTIWTNIYAAPIAARLNQHAPGANLTPVDVYNLMSLCAFDSVAKEKFSPFCNLFSLVEFQQFSYYGDLDKYYLTGYGNPLGPVQGVGYVNELLARLTGKPVHDHTQTNGTLDTSPLTFPLDRTMYTDFSHDNQLIAIYTALGLFPQATAPDPTKPDVIRDWRVAHMVPFSGRMVTEKLKCTKHGRDKDHVRILVDDALQPLAFCGAGSDGVCSLKAFVDSQGYARSNGAGDFEKCFN